MNVFELLGVGFCSLLVSCVSEGEVPEVVHAGVARDAQSVDDRLVESRLSSMSVQELWSIGFDRFGWDEAPPPDVSRDEVVDWLLEDQRLSIYWDAVGDEYED